MVISLQDGFKNLPALHGQWYPAFSTTCLEFPQPILDITTFHGHLIGNNYQMIFLTIILNTTVQTLQPPRWVIVVTNHDGGEGWNT